MTAHKKMTKTYKYVTGTILHRSVVSMPLGIESIITVTYDGPSEPAPEQGAAWPPEKDWPSAKLSVTLPRHGDDRVVPEVVCPTELAGESLGASCANWGAGSLVAGYSTIERIAPVGASVRYREVRRVGASLRVAVAELLRQTSGELAVLRRHLEARAARLAQREATLAAGCDQVPVRVGGAL